MSKITIMKDSDGLFQYETDINGRYYLHLELFNWSPYVYKKAKLILNKWMSVMHQEGVLVVFVVIPDNDPKLYKFENLFGFKEVMRDNGMILMFQETERV